MHECIKERCFGRTDIHSWLNVLSLSTGGHLYIATFLDDYSKLSVVRVISSKSDTVDIVPKVIAAMENSSGYKVGTVRTDNGGEYINSFLSDYLSKRGVVTSNNNPLHS